MKYSPERSSTIKEIDVIGPIFSRIKTQKKTIKGWINFRINRHITWSFNYHTGQERLWLNSGTGARSYAEIEDSDLRKLVKGVLLILHFRAYFGAKRHQLPNRFWTRISKKEMTEARREFAKFYRIRKHKL